MPADINVEMWLPETLLSKALKLNVLALLRGGYKDDSDADHNMRLKMWWPKTRSFEAELSLLQ